jgi:hypothetical protein
MVNEQHLEERASFVINTLLLPSQKKKKNFAFCFCVLYTNVFWKKKLRNKLFFGVFCIFEKCKSFKVTYVPFDFGRKKNIKICLLNCFVIMKGTKHENVSAHCFVVMNFNVIQRHCHDCVLFKNEF